MASTHRLGDPNSYDTTFLRPEHRGMEFYSAKELNHMLGEGLIRENRLVRLRAFIAHNGFTFDDVGTEPFETLWRLHDGPEDI